MSILIYVIIDLPLLATPKDPFCSINSHIKILLNALSWLFTYFILWLRTFEAFYRNKLFKIGLGKAVQFINLSSMPFFLATNIAILVSYLLQPGNVYANCGCMSVLTRKTSNNFAIAIVISTALFQAGFLFCLAYPLRLHRKKMLDNGCDNNFIIPIIKRAAIAAVVCVISDTFTFTFTAIYRAPNRYVQNIFLTLNLVINLFATIWSFANWQDKVFPFGKRLSFAASDVKNQRSCTQSTTVAFIVESA